MIIKTKMQTAMLALLIIMSQVTSAEETVSNDLDRQESGDHSYASFSVSGAQQGQKSGEAVVGFDEFSRHLTKIEIVDSVAAEEQTFRLSIQADANKFLGLPSPGEYPIINRRDPETGFEGGFYVNYTHIIENKGSRYANVALEYDVPPGWKLASGAPSGTVIIETVDDTYITGRFEFELRENASINDAPRKDEKTLVISGGRFKALIPKPVD